MLHFFRRRRWDEERAREIEAHIAHHVDDLVARGLAPAEARHQALRDFGNPTLIREDIYTMNSIPLIETLIRDARYAVRVLRKSPAFTFAAVLTLGVAIGINVAVFSVVDAVLLRPLPYPAADRLGLVETTLAGSGEVRSMTSQHGVTWATIRDHASTVDRAVFSTWTSGINVIGQNRASHARQQRVGAGFFRVLGVAPRLGREFTPEEDRRGGPGAVILSHAYWRAAFGGDAGILGQPLTLGGEPHVIVGVMPDGFHSGSDADLWRPLRATTDGEGDGENYQILLRLREGRTWGDADAELARLASDILRQRPAAQGTTATFATVPLHQGLTTSLRSPLTLLWTAVFVVLAVACVNLAGLLLARTSSRTREIATRMALGSGRGAVTRQLLVESVVLAVAGALAGILLGWIAVENMRGAVQAMGIWQPVGVEWRAVALASGLAALAAAGFGLLPAVQATRLDVQGGLAAGSTRGVAGSASHWPRRVLVITQVALGVVLLVGAGLLLRTFLHLRGMDPGFDGRQVIAATVSLQDSRYRTADRVRLLSDETLRRLRATPGVQGAAFSLGLPYERLLNLGFRHLDGPEAASQQTRMASTTYIAGDYFATLRIPLRAGRVFDERDSAAAPGVVMVNEALAREYFGGANPVGRRIGLAGGEREIIGVVGDVLVRPGFGDRGPVAAMPLAYVPLAQANDGFLRLVHGWFAPSFIVRGPADGQAVLPSIRTAVDATDPLLPFARVRAMHEVQSVAIAQQRLFMVLLSTLAGATFLLAAVGIHGLIASSVAERTREMGIRLALGATAGQAVRALATPGVVLAAVGILIGVGFARGFSSVLRSYLWGVAPDDPTTFAAAGALFVLVALAASLAPALRILRVDPARTLRQQ